MVSTGLLYNRKPNFKTIFCRYKKWGNYKQGIFQPYLIACVIPQAYNSKVPQSISLVEKPCDNATNNVRVIYDAPAKKKDFAVCVKVTVEFKKKKWFRHRFILICCNYVVFRVWCPSFQY